MTAQIDEAKSTKVPRARRHWHRWGQLTTLLALVVWWPVGFLGTAAWFHLPLDVTNADQVVVGAFAAAIASSILVPTWWPRVALVTAYAVLGWVLSAPVEAIQIPHQRLALALALGVGSVVGLAVGSWAHRGVGPLAMSLAVLAPLCLVGRLQGPLLALALALPFLRATKERVVPTVLSVLGVVVLWLATTVAAMGLRYGWDTVRPGAGLTVERARSQVWDFGWGLVSREWDRIADYAVRENITWLVVAVVLAVGILVVRIARSGGRRAAG